MEEELLPEYEYGPKWSDQRAGRMLGALVCAVVALLLAMIVAVFVRAWPSFAHNGLAWFGSGGSVDAQFNAITLSSQSGGSAVYTFHAWPLIWSTILIVGASVTIGLFCSLFISVFIVEFAPEWMRSVLEPVIRFLASIPSVIYGLLGVLVIVPFIGNHLVTEHEKAAVAGVITAERLQSAGGGHDSHRDDLPADDLDLLRRVALGATGVAGGLTGAGGQPLAHDVEDRGPHGPPCDRRRNGARGGPSDRRVGDAGDGLGIGWIRAQPRRRPDLHL